jgi:hypothetical protein
VSLKKPILLLFWLLLTPVVSAANDGFGGLTATGLQFQQSASVRMVSEDLFLSSSQVRVAYVFRNDGPAEAQGEVIFPLPPISLAGLAESGFALTEESLHRENVVDFTATVNGKKIEVRTERIAILEPPYDERRQPAANYDAPGEDVTALLKGYGIPLSLNVDEVAAVLTRLPPAARETLKAKGLADFFDGEPPLPAWSIIVRYHWPQTFAAGREIRIEHSYNPAPPGGIFVWPAQEKDADTYHRELIQTYCIDAGTRKALAKRLHHQRTSEMAGTGTAILLDYVLTTASTWHGPIGVFRLTIDKGMPSNILSLCIDGLRKTGPTTFAVEKKDFNPTRDLRLLIVSGLEE